MKTLLKKASLVIAGLSFVSFAYATKHTVTVANFSFTPSSFTAAVGDTVEWVWASGSHTTTYTSIPAGAATWSNPINTSNKTFDYVITVAGTYDYWCAIHTVSMEASFTVTVSGVAPVASNSSKTFATLFPNPASNVLNIHLNNSPNNNELIITDILGNEITKKTLTGIDNSINISTWKKGIYFYRLKNGNETMEGKFEVE